MRPQDDLLGAKQQEGLQSFFAVYAPDQVASAGEVAAMFSDDFDALQSLLSKKYGACLSLSPGTLTCGTSMQQEVDMLIDEVEGVCQLSKSAKELICMTSLYHASDF